MKLFIFGFVMFLLFLIPRVRCLIFNFPLVLWYLPRDIFFYFYYKKYNKLEGGVLNCYIADKFGGGKTLSATAYIVQLYTKYNDKPVYDPERKMFVTQKVHVLSNVEFSSIPYQLLTDLGQIVNCADKDAEIDLIQGTKTVVLVLLDEASSQLNSRRFRDNFADFSVLSTLLCCRHYCISMWYTSQTFCLVDKLLRDVTQRVVHCSKGWRTMVQRVYSAIELENATNPTLIKPIFTKTWFIQDKHFRNYDTYAVVDNLKKDMNAGNMLSAEEIINLRGQIQNDYDSANLSLKGRRRRKRAAG